MAAAAGCSTDDSIEARIKHTLNNSEGVEVDDVECPPELVPEKVTSAQCVVTGDFSQYVLEKTGIQTNLTRIGVTITFGPDGEPRAEINEARLAADIAVAATDQLSDAPPATPPAETPPAETAPAPPAP
ncbi:MAG: hypothetical protein ACT4PW_00100 [Acidimicrobiia bacterium]